MTNALRDDAFSDAFNCAKAFLISDAPFGVCGKNGFRLRLRGDRRFPALERLAIFNSKNSKDPLINSFSQLDILKMRGTLFEKKHVVSVSL